MQNAACPQVMVDPVRTVDGNVYEREAISRLLRVRGKEYMRVRA